MDEKTTPKKTRRVGTLAFALVLILAGVLLMVYQLVPAIQFIANRKILSNYPRRAGY